jgi:hypothetical protein
VIRHRSLPVALLALALSLATPGSGPAQSTLSPEAEKAFQRGVLAAQQSQWTVALRYFEEARKTAPSQPQILFNTGLAESKLSGRELRAIAWFRAYLAASPGATNEKAVRELIEGLEVRVEGTIEKILREARDLAVKIPDRFERNYTLGEIGKRQAATGDVQAAKETVARITPGFTSGPSTVAEALAEAGDVASARQMLEAISSDDPDHITRSSAYSRIAPMQARRGDVAGAEATLSAIKRENYRISGLFGMAQALFQAGRKAESAALVTRAKDAIMALPDASRGSYYPSLGQMQASIDDVTAALQTASLIQKPEEKAQVFGAINASYQRRFDERLAAGDLAEARRLASTLTSPAIRSSAYLALSRTHLAARDWDESLRALDEVADTDQDKPLSYGRLAEALVAAGDLSRARQVLASAATRLGKMQQLFLPELVSAYVAAGDLDGGKRVIGFVQNKQNALLRYALGQVKAGDLAGARQTTAGMQKDHQHDRALTIVAEQEIATGTLQAAEQTLSMIADPKNVPHRMMAEAELAAGDFAGALRHAPHISDIDYRSWMYRDIARRQLEHGQLDAARATMTLIPKREDIETVLLTMATRQADQGDMPGAFATFNAITKKSPWMYLSMVSTQVTSGDRQGAEAAFMQAKALVDGMTDTQQQSSSYPSLVYYGQYYLAPGPARQTAAAAKSAIRSVVDAAQRVSALTALAGYERSMMAWTESRQSLLLAMEAAASLAPGAPRNDALKGIVGAQASGGDLAGARETAARLATETDRDEALARSGWDQKSAGNAAGLRELLALLTTKDVRDRVAADLVEVLAQKGDRTAAAQIAATISGDSYYRPSAFAALAIAHVKARDLAAAKGAAAQLRDGSLSSADMLVAFADAGEAAWAEQSLRLVSESSRDDARIRVAAARAARGDIAHAATVLARAAKLSARATLCEGVAATGEVRAVSDCAAALPTPALRVPVLLRLAGARTERGDLRGAQTILTGLRTERPGADALVKIASAQVVAGDESGARETLALVHGNDAEFAPWAAHVIATAQPVSKIPHAIGLARAIIDPFWRDRALLALLRRATDPAAVDTLLGAVTDPMLRSQARLQVARGEIGNGRLAGALKQVEQIPDTEARATALSVVASSGLPGARGPATVQLAASLPDGAAKAYLFLDLARGRLAAGDAAGAVPLLRTTETALRSMSESYWKAQALAEVAQIATQTGATMVAETTMRLARDTGERLPAPEKARWVAFLNRPAVSAEVQATRAGSEGAERAKQWVSMIEGRLNDQTSTDLAGQVQSITAQANSKDMVKGLLGVADTLISRSKDIKAEADKARKE